MTEHKHDGFTHNVDLRLSGVTGETFEQRFPQFLFAFSDPELQALFDPLDRAALTAKRRARRWGMIAVGLIAFSLIVTAIDVAFGKQPWYGPLVIAAVIAGALGVVIGFMGVMIAGSKDAWLRKRFVCERIRQLHFQTLIRWAPTIIDAASTGDHRTFLEARALRTAEFKARVLVPSAARLGALLKDHDDEPWLVKPKGDKLPEGPDTAAYFDALEELRLRHQIDYVEMQLQPDGGWFPNSPIERQKLLTGFAVFCVFAILILHVGALLGVLHIGVTSEQKPYIHAFIIVLAILALAARTIEEGLQVHHEVERYRAYSSSLQIIEERMRHASDAEARRSALLELEEVSYAEMVNFLKSHHEAKFVM